MTDSSAPLQQALMALDKLHNERPSWSQPISMLREILPVVGQKTSAAPPMSVEAAQLKIRGQTPILRGVTLPLDTSHVQTCWQSLCEIVARYRDDTTASAMSTLWSRSDWSLQATVGKILAGAQQQVRQQASAAGWDATLLLNLLRWTLFPHLSALQSQFAVALNDAQWPHGHCPMCGNWPLLAEFRGLEQTRFLRCGCCAAAWHLGRLHCPFCDNRDHRRLGFIYVEGEQSRFRASICEQCGGYVKSVATIQALPPLHLFVMDVATLHLDLAAVEGVPQS